ncbi:hypothetical protein [Kitasatospora purpeofusca]|uniref:hypothetical protein n=1 Tax=Kitasatospora purpeofusca TaxID=67352 RepID=UPI00366817EE
MPQQHGEETFTVTTLTDKTVQAFRSTDCSGANALTVDRGSIGNTTDHALLGDSVLVPGGL